MNKLVKRILGTIAVTAAVALSGFLLPETVLLPDLSVTASADTEFTEAATWTDLQIAFTAGGNVRLADDVTADNGDRALEVPEDTYVILDLNGYTLDRGLTSPTSCGNVITVNGNLTLTDSSTGKTGTITGGKNDSSSGGGVFVNGTFTMQGGTISECKIIDGYGYGSGGVYVENGAKFTMSGGKISGCSADGPGGGVYVSRYSKFTMSGGEIRSCWAHRGGGVLVYGGEFTMSGGTISGCSTDDNGSGGGVYVESITDSEGVHSGTFTMSDGTISDCSAVMDGGGVCVNGTFTMSDSTISGCSAVQRGGGVSVENGGTFTMSDGTISGCSSVMNGGGVYVYNSGTFNISDTPVISGNTVSAAANNVVTTKTINVTGELTTDASVYVHAEKGVAVAVGGGYTLTESDAECFHSDIDAALASVLDNGKIVFKAELPELVDIGSVTYNGNAQSPELTFVGKALTKDTDYTVSYKLGDTAVTEAKNAGTYTVTVTGIGAYSGTFEKSYTINKKPVIVSGITAKDKTYDGTTAAELDYSGETFGKCVSDDLTITATVTFKDANAGTGKRVNITNITLGGADAGNYVLAESGSQTSTKADITARSITIKAEDQEIEFGGSISTDKSFAGITSGSLANEGILLRCKGLR